MSQIPSKDDIRRVFSQHIRLTRRAILVVMILLVAGAAAGWYAHAEISETRVSAVAGDVGGTTGDTQILIREWVVGEDAEWHYRVEIKSVEGSSEQFFYNVTVTGFVFTENTVTVGPIVHGDMVVADFDTNSSTYPSSYSLKIVVSLPIPP